MAGLEHLLLGFQVAITPFNLVMAVIGIVLGTIIGVLPGLGGANGVAILLPLTFTMSPTSAIILLTSIYWGALFGGAITSILFNIPGEPWSVATTLDGYPMAKQGKGAQALTAAFTSSFIGALFAILLVSFFAQPLAELALKFGPPEFFAIQLLTFSSFIGLGGGSPIKSFASIVLGFILGAIGLDVVTGRLRLTFGSIELMRGRLVHRRRDRPVRPGRDLPHGGGGAPLPRGDAPGALPGHGGDVARAGRATGGRSSAAR